MHIGVRFANSPRGAKASFAVTWKIVWKAAGLPDDDAPVGISGIFFPSSLQALESPPVRRQLKIRNVLPDFAYFSDFRSSGRFRLPFFNLLLALPR